MRKINKQLESKKVKIRGGKAIVDATITETPFRPKGKAVYDVIEDKTEDNENKKSNYEMGDKSIVINKGGDEFFEGSKVKDKTRSVKVIKR